MVTEKNNPEKPNYAVIIAIIGAIATILTACVTGFFTMVPAVLERLDQRNIPKTALVEVSTATQANAAVPASIVTPAPSDTITPEPTATDQPPSPTLEPTATEIPPSPTPQAGLLFASKIAANGLALDPGSEFHKGINELYAVFPAEMPLPGTMISANNQQKGSYYAFMRVEPGSSTTRIGWRWIYKGAVVNDYEMDMAPGNDIWLSYANPQEGGIFGNAPFGPGKYTIVITMGGNALISSELVILP